MSLKKKKKKKDKPTSRWKEKKLTTEMISIWRSDRCYRRRVYWIIMLFLLERHEEQIQWEAARETREF